MAREPVAEKMNVCNLFSALYVGLLVCLFSIHLTLGKTNMFVNRRNNS